MTKRHFLVISYSTKWPLCVDVPLNTYSFIHSNNSAHTSGPLSYRIQNFCLWPWIQHLLQMNGAVIIRTLSWSKLEPNSRFLLKKPSHKLQNFIPQLPRLKIFLGWLNAILLGVMFLLLARQVYVVGALFAIRPRWKFYWPRVCAKEWDMKRSSSVNNVPNPCASFRAWNCTTLRKITSQLIRGRYRRRKGKSQQNKS